MSVKKVVEELARPTDEEDVVRAGILTWKIIKFLAPIALIFTIIEVFFV
ncbi:hypothetical protein [Halovulum marinum]|nr:hypothetical protein [Halovulum marinum]